MMRFTNTVFFSGLLTLASAHFHLQYPVPRGPFVMNNEPTFCDGYADAVSNRTQFPLSNGIISITSEHPAWTLGVIISTVQDPNNFANFTDPSGNEQLAKPFFETTGEGAFCMPIDLAAANISGVTDGANVTIQLIFDGGDGELFQCADLTLSSSISGNPSNVSCTNATDSVATPASQGATPTLTSTSSSGSSSGSSSSGAPSPSQSTGNGASVNAVFSLTSLLGLAGTVLALL